MKWLAIAIGALFLALAATAFGQSIEGGGAPAVSPNIFHPSGGTPPPPLPCSGPPAGGQLIFNQACNAVYYANGMVSP